MAVAQSARSEFELANEINSLASGAPRNLRGLGVGPLPMVAAQTGPHTEPRPEGAVKWPLSNFSAASNAGL
jgi:hypothetical protein